MIKFKCVHCGQKLQAEDRKAGSEARCPACSNSTPVPSCHTMVIERSPLLIPQQEAMVFKEYAPPLTTWHPRNVAGGVAGHFRRQWAKYLLPVALLVAIDTWWVPQGPWLTASYLSALAVAPLVGIIVSRWVPRHGHWVIGAGFLLAVPAVVCYNEHTWIVEEWTNKSGNRVVDYYRRTDYGTPRWRELFADDGANSWRAEGGFSESGKLHGHWKTVLRSPHFETVDDWYWYGDKVTEGEWQLRSGMTNAGK